MKRTAIIIEKSMSIGAAANISAIIMGQLSLLDNSLYDSCPVEDSDKNLHASIKYSTVLLKAGKGQLETLAGILNQNKDSVNCVLFTEIGRSLNNSYQIYYEKLISLKTNDTGVIGIGISGDDKIVKNLTKKFSIL